MIATFIAASIISYDPWATKRFDCRLIRPNGKPFRVAALIQGRSVKTRYGQVTSYSAPFPSIRKQIVSIKKNREIVASESVNFAEGATILSYEFDYTIGENGMSPVKVTYMNLEFASANNDGIFVGVGFCKERL